MLRMMPGLAAGSVPTGWLFASGKVSWDLAEALAEADPRNAQARTDLSLCVRKLGNVVRNTSPEEAIVLYRRSQALTSALLANAPANTDFRRYQALNSMGLAAPLASLKRYGEALRNLLSSREALEELRAQDREN